MNRTAALPLPRTRAHPKASSLASRVAGPVGMQVSLLVVTLVLIVAHQGKLLELAFTPMTVPIAWRLYRRYPAHYLGFVCWLFFLTPEVRRFADFFNGSFNPRSMIMVAPLLAAAISGMAVFTHYRMLGQRCAAPLLLIMTALLYAFLIGVVRAGIAPAAFTLCGWMFPTLIGFRMIVTWQEYPAYHRVLLKTFVYGTFVMGAYGVIQFVSPPPWDAFWLISSGMESDGLPVPFSMRIPSTMNSSGPFGIAIMVGLLMSLAARGKMRAAAAVVGVPALLFTSVRAAWGGWTIGLLYPLAMLDGRSRVRLIVGVVAFAGICMPLTMIDEIATPLIKRVESFQNINDDSSYRVRENFYKNFLFTALSDISGEGFGMTGIGTKLADDPTKVNVVFDSGLMEVPYVMGWPGTLLYATGLLTLIWRAFAASYARKRDRVAISGVGTALAIFSMMIFMNTLQAAGGMFFMIGVVMPVIGLRYSRAMNAHASPHKTARVDNVLSPAVL
jgi:hypothetical protein